MKGNRNLLCLLAIAVLLSGCATAHLTIEVDLYNEDPQYAIPLSPKKTAALRNAVERIKGGAQIVAADRIIKAAKDQALYDIARCLRDGKDRDAQTLDGRLLETCAVVRTESQEDLQRYSDAVWAQQEDVISEADFAEAKLKSYLTAYSNFWAERNCNPVAFSEDSWWQKLKKKHKKKFDPKKCTYVPIEDYGTIETEQAGTEDDEEVSNSGPGHVTGRSSSIDPMSESYSRRKKPNGGLESKYGYEMRIQETLAADAVNRVAVKYVVLSGELETEFERKKAAQTKNVFSRNQFASLEKIKELEREKINLSTSDKTNDNELEKHQAEADLLLNKREKIWSQIESANEHLLLPALRSDAVFQLKILKEELERFTEEIDRIRGEIQSGIKTQERLKTRQKLVVAELKKLKAFSNELKKQIDKLARQLLEGINKYLFAEQNKTVSHEAFQQISDYLSTASPESNLAEEIRDIDSGLTGNRRLEALENLRDLVISSSIFYNVLDRMQDPANPVWRLITAKENEENWNKNVAGTRFSGQGKSTVVVVRDSPLKFRVQQGANDPSELIKSQLAISRSIASASISVIAASQGVSLPLSVPLGGGETDVSTSRGDESAEKAALQKALENKAEVDLFKQILRNMERNLIASRRNLERISDDQDELMKQEQTRLKEVLKQHKTLLSSMDKK